jgi:hypothetical protein
MSACDSCDSWMVCAYINSIDNGITWRSCQHEVPCPAEEYRMGMIGGAPYGKFVLTDSGRMFLHLDRLTDKKWDGSL